MSKALRNLRLDEVSLVDNPANKSATVSLFKRQTNKADFTPIPPDDAQDIEVLNNPDAATQREWADTANAALEVLLNRGMDEESSREIAKQIATERLTRGGKRARKSTDAGSPGNTSPATTESTMSEQDTEKRLGELETQMSSLTSEVEKHGLHVQTDDDGNVSVAKADSDETVTDPDGNVVRKSEVGETQFRAIKSMADRLSEMNKERMREQMTKAAESRWPNLPGEPTQKGALYAELSGISDDEVRKFAFERMDTEDRMIASNMGEIGKAGGRSASEPMQKLESMAQERAEKTGESREQAFAKVCDTDEGAKLYEQYIHERAS